MNQMAADELELIRFKGRPCILCGKTAHNGAIYTPTTEMAARLGRPSLGNNAVHRLVYALCTHCSHKPKWHEAVEAKLLSEAKAK